MGSQCDVASFVLRFRQHQRHDETGQPRIEYRGHICHVQEDDKLCFTDLADAVEFIRARLAASQPGIETICDSSTRDLDKGPMRAGSVIVELEDSLPA